jgi:dihydrofolate reductase
MRRWSSTIPDCSTSYSAGRQDEAMTKTQYYTASSIDGYIADPDNSLDWLLEADSGGEGYGGFDAFFAGVGAFAMGATTYGWMAENLDASYWERSYGDTPAWVFTHRQLPRISGANLTVVAGDVRPVHEAMVAAAGGKNIWLVGGGELVGQFADQGLLDEIIVSVAPVTLGGGAPLLPRRLLSSRLKLVAVERAGEFANLTYSVARP